MSYEDNIKEIVRLIKESEKTYALTGAGISTESGIPDYRSPGTGLWEKQNPAKTVSLSALRSDPALFYSTNIKRWTSFNEVQPNTAHYALAQLEKMGFLEGVITQNIDSLHVKAGSKDVWEVHGHLRTCRCTDCLASHSFEHLVQSFDNGENPPRCLKCGGVLRPDVVLFEDQMNDDYYRISHEILGCQLLLVVGSSLTVYPVASLPSHARELVIINNTPTPYDNEAAVVVHESAGNVFRDIMRELGVNL